MLQLYLRQDKQAYRLLRDALAAFCGLSELPPISRTPAGKPFFPDHPHLHFNLSHTKGWSLCALSDKPVGVDIEVIQPRNERLFRYCLTEEEYLQFDGTWPDFFRFWTLKEARCKHLGQRLGHPRSWPVPPPCPHRSYLTEHFAAAVCGEEIPPENWILL